MSKAAWYREYELLESESDGTLSDDELCDLASEALADSMADEADSEVTP